MHCVCYLQLSVSKYDLDNYFTGFAAEQYVDLMIPNIVYIIITVYYNIIYII